MRLISVGLVVNVLSVGGAESLNSGKIPTK